MAAFAAAFFAAAVLATALFATAGVAVAAATELPTPTGDPVRGPTGDPIRSAAASGDPVRGEAIYSRCIACHALSYDRTGPRHCGLFGRRAGSVDGFDYSTAMKQSGIVWNEASLDRFLADPMKVVPGTTMGYAGIGDAGERADLIAWLRQANDSPGCNQ